MYFDSSNAVCFVKQHIKNVKKKKKKKNRDVQHVK